MEYKTFPVDKITPDPNQPRKHISQEALEEMAVSIRNEGVINAIELDEDFVIVTGEQRWRAAKIAGLKEVPVKVLKGLTKEARFIRQVQENLHHNTMSALDTAEAFDKVLQIIRTTTPGGLVRDKKHTGEKYQQGIKELHELFGIAPSTIAEFLEILGTKGVIREALKDPAFGRTKLRELRYLPENYRNDIERLVAKQKTMTRDTVRNVIKAVTRAQKYGEEDKLNLLFKQDFNDLNTLQALKVITKIIPDEESRFKEPADAAKFIADKAIELMDFLEAHPLESFDALHASLVVRDINSLGFFLGEYLKSKKLLK